MQNEENKVKTTDSKLRRNFPKETQVIFACILLHQKIVLVFLSVTNSDAIFVLYAQ
jgi:hypothetical protein